MSRLSDIARELPPSDMRLPFNPSDLASKIKPYVGASSQVDRIYKTLCDIDKENVKHAGEVRRMSISIENDMRGFEDLLNEVYARIPEVESPVAADRDIQIIFNSIKALPQAFDKSDRHFAEDSISAIIGHIESIVNDPKRPIMDEEFLDNTSVALKGLIARSASLSLAWLMEDQKDSMDRFKTGMDTTSRIKDLLDSVSTKELSDTSDFGHGVS